MGSQHGLRRDQHPAHTVYLDDYYIDVHEVTNAQFRVFLEANPDWRKDRIQRKYHDGDYLKGWRGLDYPAGQDNYPVTYVSWYAAQAYAAWANKQLPTEAEWEKAARGKQVGQVYPWGNVAGHEYANYAGKSQTDRWFQIAPVKQFRANGYGLYDVAGNVWEWCADVYGFNFYATSADDNPVNEVETALGLSPLFRVKRGGAWNSVAMDIGVAVRGRSEPTQTNGSCGFRCVRRLLAPTAVDEPDALPPTPAPSVSTPALPANQ